MYDDDDEEPAESICPYCAETDPCEHALLILDVTFRCAEGGALDDAFSAAWAAIYDLYPDGDVEEDIEIDALLDIVEGIADGEAEEFYDGTPGMSSKSRIFYCSSRERVQSGAANFAVQVEDYLKHHKLAPKS